jgi:hypothetical protein
MGGFFSSPEANSSMQVGNMGMSGSKVKDGATAPRVNEMKKLTGNIETGIPSGTNVRVHTTASDPGTPGVNKSRNSRSPNSVEVGVNNLKEVVVEEPPQANAGKGVVGNNQAGGRRYRKGSRKAHRRQSHRSRRR